MFERCLYFNINALVRKVNKVWDQAFQQYGLSPSHAYLLRVVLANPGMTQQEIANELQLEKSTVARFVEALLKQKWVRRERFGRQQRVYPTQASLAIEQQLEQQGNALYQLMIDRIGEQALIDLVADLRKTAKQID